MPSAIRVIDQASEIVTDTSNFDGNLSGADTTVQAALETLDELSAAGGTPGGSTTQVQYNNAGAFGGAAGLIWNAASSPNVQITAQNAAHVPLVLKLAASHSANGFELQNSIGTVLMEIEPSGTIDVRGNALESNDLNMMRVDGSNNLIYGQGTTIPDMYFYSTSSWRIYLGGTNILRMYAQGIYPWEGNKELGSASYRFGTFFTTLANISGNTTLGAGANLILDTATGTKIGTATTQKIGFWNVTPVVQQVLATGAGATVDNVISLLQTLGLCKQS